MTDRIPTVNRFVVGEAYCLLTMRKLPECDHCAGLANQPPSGPGSVVTAVDRNSGTVTIAPRCPYGAHSVSACRLPDGHDGHHMRVRVNLP